MPSPQIDLLYQSNTKPVEANGLPQVYWIFRYQGYHVIFWLQDKVRNEVPYDYYRPAERGLFDALRPESNFPEHASRVVAVVDYFKHHCFPTVKINLLPIVRQQRPTFADEYNAPKLLFSLKPRDGALVPRQLEEADYPADCPTPYRAMSLDNIYLRDSDVLRGYLKEAKADEIQPIRQRGLWSFDALWGDRKVLCSFLGTNAGTETDDLVNKTRAQLEEAQTSSSSRTRAHTPIIGVKALIMLRGKCIGFMVPIDGAAKITLRNVFETMYDPFDRKDLAEKLSAVKMLLNSKGEIWNPVDWGQDILDSMIVFDETDARRIYLLTSPTSSTFSESAEKLTVTKFRELMTGQQLEIAQIIRNLRGE